MHINIGVVSDPTTADIRFARCMADDHKVGQVSVWIDGQRVIEEHRRSGGGGDAALGGNSYYLAEMLNRITAQGIELMEAYRGPGQIPGQFHWDGCGAIVIWTRYNPLRDTTRASGP